MQKYEQLSLVDAAFRLRLSYNATMRLVLRGDLRGCRDGRHWQVDLADVERLERERHAAVTQPAA